MKCFIRYWVDVNRAARAVLAGCVILLAARSVSAALFEVETLLELERALSVASTNAEDDILRIAPGTYVLNDTLRYDTTNENHALTLEVPDGYAVLNAAGYRRGMYIWTRSSGSSVTLKGLIFTNGFVTNPDIGAGLFARTQAADIMLDGCCFVDNRASALYTSTEAAGAFLRIENGGTLTLQNCQFSNNYAKGTGGGLYFVGGFGANAVLRNNLWVTNVASTKGGGAYLNLIRGTVCFENNTCRDNLSGMGEGGGGFYLRLYYDDSTVVFNNNILWGNTAQSGVGDDVFLEDDGDGNGTGALIRVSWNDVGILEAEVGDRLTETNNIHLDPQLGDAFHLQADSPCINAGTNMTWTTEGADLDGQTRCFNGRVDIGADEAVIEAVGLIRTNGPSEWAVFPGAQVQLETCDHLIRGAWLAEGGVYTASAMQVAIPGTNASGDIRYYRLKWLWE